MSQEGGSSSRDGFFMLKQKQLGPHQPTECITAPSKNHVTTNIVAHQLLEEP